MKINAKRSIYVKMNGDPYHPGAWELYDYASGAMLHDVVGMTFKVEANARTEATLRFTNGNFEQVDVVAAPPNARARGQLLPDGTEVVVLSLHHEPNPSGSDKIFALRAERFETRNDALVAKSSKDIVLRRAIDALTLSPNMVLGHELDVMAARISGYLVGELAQDSGANVQMTTDRRFLLGGRQIPTFGRNSPNIGPAPYPSGGVVKTKMPTAPASKAKCTECAGSGYWENPISGKKDKCSNGCKP